MKEIILSEEQLDELASRIAEKFTEIMKQKENEKIKLSINQARLERQSNSFKIS